MTTQGSQKQRRTGVKEILPSQLPKIQTNASRVGKKDKGSRQHLCKTQYVRNIHPGQCSCGCKEFKNLRPLHQNFELPKIVLHVIHFILFKGRCAKCGKESQSHHSRWISHRLRFQFYGFCRDDVRLLGMYASATSGFPDKVRPLSYRRRWAHPLSLEGLNKLLERCSQALKRPWE